jgi:hypothetical protein
MEIFSVPADPAGIIREARAFMRRAGEFVKSKEPE